MRTKNRKKRTREQHKDEPTEPQQQNGGGSDGGKRKGGLPDALGVAVCRERKAANEGERRYDKREWGNADDVYVRAHALRQAAAQFDLGRVLGMNHWNQRTRTTRSEKVGNQEGSRKG